jgi:GNAT superfamily N-acetyltransferase
MLARFETDGLITRERSAEDGRRQVIRLTDRGRVVYSTLDARSAREGRKLLDTLANENRTRLLQAMATIRSIPEDTPRPQSFVLRPPGPGDYGWIIQRHGVLYAEEFGWDETFEALVARIVADYVSTREAQRENAWIAEVDGTSVGCVFCVRRDERIAQLRLLLVDRKVRGMGIGSRLVEECLRFARRAGYESITLWTNDVLADARRIYERAGFTLAEEETHHSFGHNLVGQNWWRSL